MQCAKQEWHKGMCVWDPQRSFPRCRGRWGVGLRSLLGGSPVLLRQGASVSENTWGQEHPDHLECLSGLAESGEAFYISQAIACHSFSFFPYPLYFFSPAWLRFIISLFMLSVATRKRNKEDWENPIFLCLAPFTVLVCLYFPSFFFSFKKFLCCCSALG